MRKGYPTDEKRLSTGNFPFDSNTPFIKKPPLDKGAPSNYRWPPVTPSPMPYSPSVCNFGTIIYSNLTYAHHITNIWYYSVSIKIAYDSIIITKLLKMSFLSKSFVLFSVCNLLKCKCDHADISLWPQGDVSEMFRPNHSGCDQSESLTAQVCRLPNTDHQSQWSRNSQRQ